jgi:hypothetical protein
LTPSLKIHRPPITNLDAGSSLRVKRSGNNDVQGMYWVGDMGRDLRASDEYISRELGRRRVSGRCVVHICIFALARQSKLVISSRKRTSRDCFRIGYSTRPRDEVAQVDRCVDPQKTTASARRPFTSLLRSCHESEDEARAEPCWTVVRPSRVAGVVGDNERRSG